MYIAGGLILYAVSQNADAVVVMPKACCGLISCSVRAGLRVTAIRRWKTKKSVVFQRKSGEKSLSLSRTECERRGGSERRAAATNGPQGSRVVWGIAIVLNAGRMSFICNLQRTVREGRVKPSLTFVERITVDWILCNCGCRKMRLKKTGCFGR